MSQRDSGYERKERDLYETPAWVTEELVPHLPGRGWMIWEPACGSGKMVEALKNCGLHLGVLGTDIEQGDDFLKMGMPAGYSAIVTNPPYALATDFIIHAITMKKAKFVAMLLRTDFDHAKTRRCLFADCPMFARKLVLTRRIKWFENSKGQPSFNHAWFIWDREHRGPPTLAYAP